VGDSLLFVASDGSSAHQLWKTGGSPASTVLVKDVFPGAPAGAGVPSSLTSAAGLLFFVAHDATSDGELWRSDGTAAGTFRVRDIAPGLAPSSPQDITGAGAFVLFSASNAASGRELWRSDGTAAGTAQVQDIKASTRDAAPNGFVAVGDKVFFSADDETRGVELWATNAQTGETSIVKDIRPGSLGSLFLGYATMPVGVNGILYFRANDGTHGEELWRSDGTDAGTYMVRDIIAGPDGTNITHFTAANGRLFFVLTFGGQSQLWTSDGTDAGTARVGNVLLLPDFNQSRLATLGNSVYFSGFIPGAPDLGTELMRSDGTAAGTAVVKDVWPGSFNSGVGNITSVGSSIFFKASDSTGLFLWNTDGTDAGTVALKLFTSDPYRITDVHGAAVFNANDGTGERLWRSDGTPGGTVPLDLNLPPGLPHVGEFITPGAGDTFFFTAFLSLNNRWWVRSNGTAAGTVLLQQVNPGTSSNKIFFSTTIGDSTFLADDARVYQSDGTVAGTFEAAVLRTIDSNNPSFFASPFAVASDTLFYVGDDGARGFEVWKLATLPDAPSVLDATAAGGTTVNVSWQDNSSNESGFVVERRSGAAGPWVALGTVQAGVTQYADATAAAGQQYFYRARATNPAGRSDPSNADGAATPARPVAPSAPDLDPGSDSGVSDMDNVTNDNTPTFSGAAPAGTTVRLFADGVEVGSAVAVAGGGWTIIAPVLADGAHRFTATATDAAGNASPVSAPLLATIDTAPPTVQSGAFDYLVAPHAVGVMFAEDVAGAGAIANVTLENLTTSQPVSPAQMALVYDAAARQSRLTFPGLPGGLLLDGKYRLTFAGAGITDLAGNALAGGNFAFDFLFLRGDANHDGIVNLNDFNILAANFGQSNRTFAQGDFDYSGNVNLTDFNILASRFGTNLNVGRTGTSADFDEALRLGRRLSTRTNRDLIG
jgi:ELWxxDGT repeat protein